MNRLESSLRNRNGSTKPYTAPDFLYHASRAAAYVAHSRFSQPVTLPGAVESYSDAPFTNKSNSPDASSYLNYGLPRVQPLYRYDGQVAPPYGVANVCPTAVLNEIQEGRKKDHEAIPSHGYTTEQRQCNAQKEANIAHDFSELDDIFVEMVTEEKSRKVTLMLTAEALKTAAIRRLLSSATCGDIWKIKSNKVGPGATEYGAVHTVSKESLAEIAAMFCVESTHDAVWRRLRDRQKGDNHPEGQDQARINETSGIRKGAEKNPIMKFLRSFKRAILGK